MTAWMHGEKNKNKKNKSLWAYLLHIEAQKHKLAVYMQTKNADFPESLLQQYNFQKVAETIPTDEATDESEEKEDVGAN